MALETCAGRVHKKNDSMCKRFATAESKFCNSHTYLDDYTEQQLQDIINGNAKTCSGCDRWHFETVKSCKKCSLKYAARHAKDRENKQKVKEQNRKIKEEELAANPVVLCKGIRGNGKPCEELPLDGMICCADHIHIKDYTNEQLANMKKCSSCRKYKYMSVRTTCGCKRKNVA